MLAIIDEQNIDVDLKEGLIISGVEEDEHIKELSRSRNYKLFNDIQSTSSKIEENKQDLINPVTNLSYWNYNNKIL